MHRARQSARLRAAASTAVALTAVGSLLAGCSGGSTASAHHEAAPDVSSQTTARPSATTSPTASPTRSVNPASVHANELGLVPVLMYHQLTAHPKSVYDRRPADFKAELETLAREGYVPVTAADFAAGKIDIPAGKHAVVLTFDDSTLSQFAFGPDGGPKAGTAVAILEQVAKEHLGFTPTATFYVNDDPFAESTGATALGWLHSHGFEIGDHTMTHADLGQLSAAGVQKEIAGNLKMIEKAVPGIRVTTMALPFGVFPQDHALAHRGSDAGTTYDFKAVFLVGAEPSHSPFHQDFDPLAIPRIRSQSQGDASAGDKHYISSYYLPWLQKHPQERYTSDGDPTKVSFPKSFRSVLAPAYKSEANPY